jgi:trimeric autotransporter adhesin
MKLRIGCVAVGFLLFVLSMAAQTSGSSPASAQVPPPLIQFSNVATDEGGTTLSGVVSITFSLYSNQQGGEPLWTETQNNIQLDPTGHYSVELGITKPNGVPTALFTTGEARWLGVKIAGQAEQARVLLLSVPYALKAGDAATIGGLPPSAFVMAATPAGSSTAATTTPDASAASSFTPANNGDVTGLGTVDYIPIWDSTSDIISSVLYQSGTGTTAKIGINTTTPATTLDVKGGATLRGATSVMGALSLPATGTATASTGKASQPIKQAASAYNSSTSTAVNQTFEWQAEPANNDTSTASGTLNLLFGEGSAAPAQTGLQIASNGQITFATGQTFPGTGDGTITGVTAGTGLTGGGTSGNVTLANTGILGLTEGTGITVGSGQSPTIGVSSAVPLLSANNKFTGTNTFTGNQTVNGNLSATGVVTGSSYQIGSYLFAFGSVANANAFLGFAGNTTMTGTANTASGVAALYSNTTGSANTATGVDALQLNTTGGGNTATGYEALISNTTGGNNTATGADALQLNTTGGNNTATGFEALALNTTGQNNTATGSGALISNTTGANNTATGSEALNTNTTGPYNTATGVLALAVNTTGPYNTATGFEALALNTTGPYNTATGYEALSSNTTANYNTASGTQALYTNTTGEANLADGALALYSNTTGAGNTGVGADACYDNTTSNYVTCLGYSSSSSDGISNATAIGAHARVEQSNSLVLGAAGVNVGIGTTKPSNILTIGRGTGHPVSDSWETYSSRRWKTNIQTLHGSLGKVEQLRGVSYDLKANGKHEVGVIAEEVGAVVPELVTWDENGKDAQSVDYSRLTALLIEATKEQQREYRKQQAELAKALRRIRGLAAEVRETRETLRKVKAEVAAAQPTMVAAK